MAKDKKETAGAVIPVSKHTVDNVVESTSKELTANDILAADALKKWNEEKDKRKQGEMLERYANAAYLRDKTLIDLRRRRSEDEITKDDLRRRSDLVDGLMGTDVDAEFMEHHGLKGKDNGEIDFLGEKLKVKVGDHISPKIDYVDYDKKKADVRKETDRMLQEARKKHDGEMDKVRANYNKYWSRDWDY